MSQSNNTIIAKNSIFLALRMAFVLLISLYISRVVLNVLGATDYGIYNVVGGFVAMFSFLNTAMSNATQRFYNFELGRNGTEGTVKVFSASIIIQLLILIVLLLSVEIIGVWYINNKLVLPLERLSAAKWVFQFSVLSLCFVIIQVPFTGAIMAYERMDFFALLSIVDVLLKLLIVLSLKFVSVDKLIYYGFLLCAISALNFMMYFLYVRIKLRHLRFNCSIDKNLLLSMLSFSGWNTFGTFANIARMQGLNIILNAFFGPIVNAARAIAYQIESAINSFVSNVITASRPQLIQSYAVGNITRVKGMMFLITKVVITMLLIMLVPVIFNVDYILCLWLGKGYPEHTSSFVVLILLTALITNLNTPISMIVHATGKMRTYQLWTSCISLVTLPVSYLFLKLGYIPEIVFVVSFVIELMKQVISLFILRRLIDFSVVSYIKDVFVPLLVLFLIVFTIPIILVKIIEQELLRLCVICLFSVFLTPFFSYLILFNKFEKVLVREFFSKFIKFRVSKSNI